MPLSGADRDWLARLVREEVHSILHETRRFIVSIADDIKTSLSAAIAEANDNTSAFASVVTLYTAAQAQIGTLQKQVADLQAQSGEITPAQLADLQTQLGALKTGLDAQKAALAAVANTPAAADAPDATQGVAGGGVPSGPAPAGV